MVNIVRVLRSNGVFRIAQKQTHERESFKNFLGGTTFFKKNLQTYFAPGLKLSIDGSGRKPKIKLSDILGSTSTLTWRIHEATNM